LSVHNNKSAINLILILLATVKAEKGSMIDISRLNKFVIQGYEAE